MKTAWQKNLSALTFPDTGPYGDPEGLQRLADDLNKSLQTVTSWYDSKHAPKVKSQAQEHKL